MKTTNLILLACASACATALAENGDPHGQAPMLWISSVLLEK